MRNPQNHQDNPKRNRKHKLTKLEWGLIFAAGVLFLILIAMLILKPFFEIPTAENLPTAAPTTEEATEATTEAPTTLPPETTVETVPAILEKLAELYEQNQDLVGWITIPDTPIDYPVMYTPEDGEKYINKNFEGKRNAYGLPFVDQSCSMDPESQNLVIYAHNMTNGTMFGTLMDYEDEDYWRAHPVIEFSTLHEARKYEIVAAFRDRVYYKYENVFKFYQFIDARDEAHFQEAMDYYKENALYETGVEAEYGDRLITLVTCAYHTKNGRFVVVAREITDKEPLSEG